MLRFFRKGRQKKLVYAFISSKADVTIEEQESLINMWSSMSRHSIEQWFIDDVNSLLKALKAKPLPIVVFDESLIDRDSRAFIKIYGAPIISVRPKEGPPTVGC